MIDKLLSDIDCSVVGHVVVADSLSRVRLLATPWPTVYQAPPSMGLSRQEYWSGVPLLLPISLVLYRTGLVVEQYYT